MLRDLRQLLVSRAEADKEYAAKLAGFSTHAEVRTSASKPRTYTHTHTRNNERERRGKHAQT